MSDLPDEYFNWLGFKKPRSDRTLNRTLERIGKKYQFVIHNHQKVIKEQGLVSKEQFPDFSSSYFEGASSPLGELGYSRDGEFSKKQITFGISTGINGIPTALTIQKGNVQDKKHFRIMLKAAKYVLDENSVLIFDCGANTKGNKKLIRTSKYHYLTLRAKKVGPYKKLVEFYKCHEEQTFALNDRIYSCVKMKFRDEVQYIFYSESLYEDQMRNKTKKFMKELEKNKAKLKKTLKPKFDKR